MLKKRQSDNPDTVSSVVVSSYRYSKPGVISRGERVGTKFPLLEIWNAVGTHRNGVHVVQMFNNAQNAPDCSILRIQSETFLA